MTRDRFDALLREAVLQTDIPYRRARQEILDMGAEALPRVQSAREGPVDWKVLLVANVLIGWLTKKPLFDQCTRYVQGELTGPPPITGEFSAARRAKALALPGQDIVPRVLEMLLKTHEYRNRTESAALLGSLAIVKDTSAVPPLVDLVRTTSDDEIRDLTVGALAQIGDARAIPSLRKILLEETYPTAVRATTAIGLGELRDGGSRNALEEILSHESNGSELREAAVLGLDLLGTSESAPALEKVLTATQDLVLLQLAVEALGKVGASTAIRLLDDLARTHEDSSIRDAAREACREIRERLEAKRR